MEIERIYLKKTVPSTFEGYNFLIELYHSIKKSELSKFEIDFTNTTWFEANLSAVLGAIIDLLMFDGKTVTVTNILNPQLNDVLRRNGFLNNFGINTLKERQQTIIPYKTFSPTDDNEFINYIKDELLSKDDFPQLSVPLGKEMNRNIFELYENARTHGRCKQIHTCGQSMPRKKRLIITIVDMGSTIKHNVNTYLVANKSGSETIRWAMEYGNTTKTENISGGLGFSVIRDFIKLNSGKIQIVSSDGFLEYSLGVPSERVFKLQFPGTIATIEFNLADTSSYSLTSEQEDLTNIF